MLLPKTENASDENSDETNAASDKTDADRSDLWSHYRALETPHALEARSKSSLIRLKHSWQIVGK